LTEPVHQVAHRQGVADRAVLEQIALRMKDMGLVREAARHMPSYPPGRCLPVFAEKGPGVGENAIDRIMTMAESVATGTAG